MKCPTCPDATLLMSERQGVEIDYCPTCRGVWLDRGELDKLIALSSIPPAPAAAPTAAQQPNSPQAQHPQPGYGRRPDFDDSDFGKQQGGYRKKSWLKDIFD